MTPISAMSSMSAFPRRQGGRGEAGQAARGVLQEFFSLAERQPDQRAPGVRHSGGGARRAAAPAATRALPHARSAPAPATAPPPPAPATAPTSPRRREPPPNPTERARGSSPPSKKESELRTGKF